MMPRSLEHFVRVHMLWYNICIDMKHMDEMDVRHDSGTTYGCETGQWYNIWMHMEHMDVLDVEISL